MVCRPHRNIRYDCTVLLPATVSGPIAANRCITMGCPSPDQFPYTYQSLFCISKVTGASALSDSDTQKHLVPSGCPFWFSVEVIPTYHLQPSRLFAATAARLRSTLNAWTRSVPFASSPGLVVTPLLVVRQDHDGVRVQFPNVTGYIGGPLNAFYLAVCPKPDGAGDHWNAQDPRKKQVLLGTGTRSLLCELCAPS